MKKLLMLAAIVAAVALAACGGGSGNGSATAAAPGANGMTVAVKNLGDAGRVLVDSSGQALYASDQEANGIGALHRRVRVHLDAADRQGRRADRIGPRQAGRGQATRRQPSRSPTTAGPSTRSPRRDRER